MPACVRLGSGLFTLGLHGLGPDFFLRHLLTGNAAVNTLMWRWVAGHPEQGRPMLGRCRKHRKYRRAVFSGVTGLARTASPVSAQALPERAANYELAPITARPRRVGLLLHSDDLMPPIWGAIGITPVSNCYLEAQPRKARGIVRRLCPIPLGARAGCGPDGRFWKMSRTLERMGRRTHQLDQIITRAAPVGAVRIGGGGGGCGVRLRKARQTGDAPYRRSAATSTVPPGPAHAVFSKLRTHIPICWTDSAA